MNMLKVSAVYDECNKAGVSGCAYEDMFERLMHDLGYEYTGDRRYCMCPEPLPDAYGVGGAHLMHCGYEYVGENVGHE